MEFKGQGEINKLSLVEKSSSSGEGIQELSVELNFTTENNLTLIDMNENQVHSLLGNEEVKSFCKGKGSEILSDTFVFDINGFKFKGEKFTSCEVRKQEKGPYITVLKARIGFNEDFYRDAPNFFKKIINIKILSVQGTIPQPEE
jgi:hypothetical protein